MWDILASIALKLPDFFLRWADRTTVRISTKRLEYHLIRNDADSDIVVISPYPSRYHAEIGFSHRGKAMTIKSLTLVVDHRLRLEAADFSPVRLEHGDYCKKVVSFPVEESLAIKEGTFELRVIDTFDNVHKDRGRFPIK